MRRTRWPVIRSSERIQIRPIHIRFKSKSRCASAAGGRHASLVAWAFWPSCWCWLLSPDSGSAEIGAVGLRMSDRKLINQGIDSSDLPPQEKVEVKVQVDASCQGDSRGTDFDRAVEGHLREVDEIAVDAVDCRDGCRAALLRPFEVERRRKGRGSTVAQAVRARRRSTTRSRRRGSTR